MSNYDYTFACQGVGGIALPWKALRVVRFRGTEALSTPYRYEITLLETDGTTPISQIVGACATLRIATLSVPVYKTVHGIVIEAEELAQLPEGRMLRLILAPPWTRAMHRKRSRNFVHKTFRQIVETVLQEDKLLTKANAHEVEPDLGGIDFAPARERFVWHVIDTKRIDDARVRPFVAQYNESDFAFVSRLLEEEGISYHFEHGADTVLLVFADSDAGRSRLVPPIVGAGIDGREIRGFFAGARLRPEAVTVGDYNWKQPDLDISAKIGNASAARFEHVYPGGYPDNAEQGAPLAKVLLERHRTEARYARGEGWIRVLSAGTIFALEHKTSRLEGEYLVTSIEVEGEQAGVLASNPAGAASVPFYVRFTCARRGTAAAIVDSGFRPACTTPRPRIHGSQTAVVTADPSNPMAEINIGGPQGSDIGCVRLKFHWDKENSRLAKEVSSDWVRVNEPFAGSGMGGVWHPRVGTEVIVEFEEGNPDRPIVVGRVYNGKNRPYHGGSPIMSTLKSNSSPGGGVHNEITFDDSAGAELVYTNAGKDMETDVGNDRLETVAAHATMKVGSNDKETIGANCSVTVGLDEMLTVGANDTGTIAGNVTTTIGSNSLTLIGGNEVHVVGANQSIGIGALHTEIVVGNVTEVIGGSLTTKVAAAENQNIGANRTTTIAAAHTQSFGAAHVKLIGGNRTLTCGSLETNVGAASIRIAGGSIDTTVGGTQTVSAGGAIVFIGPTYSAQNADEDCIDDTWISVTGLSFTRGGVSLEATGASLSVTGLDVTVAGLNWTLSGFNLSVAGFKSGVDAADLKCNGGKTHVGLMIEL